MAIDCCDKGCSASAIVFVSRRFHKVLWVALVVNAIMFAIELAGGLGTHSVSLLADAVDFAGDAANYGITLAVLAMGSAWRSRAAMVKGLSMAAFGALVVGKTVWAVFAGAPPEPLPMVAIALLALLANAGVAVMLYAFREGDANMRSVWLCSRNDAVGNFAVIVAAAGVFGTGTRWPDLIVALIMAGLAFSSAVTVMRLARRELLPVGG